VLSNEELNRHYGQFVLSKAGLTPEDVTGLESINLGYTDENRENKLRRTALNIQEAARTGAAFILAPDKYGELDYRRVNSNRQAQGFRQLKASKAAGMRTYADLGIDSVNETRKAAAQDTLDLVAPALYASEKPFGMTYDEYKNNLLEYSRMRYGMNGQLMGKETHHIMELDTTDEYLKNLPVDKRSAVVEELVNRGMVPGDVASNFSALYASALGKNVLPKDTRPDKLDQHQKGVHPEYKRLAKNLAMPASAQFGDNVTGYPGIARARATDKQLGGDKAESLLVGITDAVNKTRSINSAMSGLSDEEQKARVLLHGYVSHLANQNVINDVVNKNNPEISRLLTGIEEQQKVIHGAANVDFERAYMNRLGVDIDDELISPTVRFRGGPRRH
jgi:hypothetical protein